MLSMNEGTINEQLAQLTSQIVEAAHPESVVLFGSQARGNANPASDYDIALIFSNREQIKPGLTQAHRALWPRKFPIDLVGFAEETVQLGRTALAREVLREGKPLYQKHEH
jgi:predicted nucleotidyltransferase